MKFKLKQSMRIALLFLAGIGVWLYADEVHDHSAPNIKVGKVVFPISCSKAAQGDVEHGLALMHSFLFSDAEDQFRAATAADPACAMTYWAQAIGLYRPLAYAPTDADREQGWKLIQQAHALRPKTRREHDYIEAATRLFQADCRDYGTRNRQYSAALEGMYRDNPNDLEAAVFYAMSLLTYADSEHPVADAKRAIGILQPVFRKSPNHPGVAHYLIHAADSPELAQMGLDAARHYAQIAPAAPHALHMPSHIFARLGLWQEDIQSNLASLQAARNPSEMHVGAENQLHAMEFLEYAYLQTGKDEEAEKMIEAQRQIDYEQVDKNLHDYVNRTRANSPALYHLETRNWPAAGALQADPDFETYNQAITYWANAVASGHLRDLAATRYAVDRYDALLQATKQGPRPNLAKSMAAKHDQAHAWLLHLEGKDTEATRLLRSLAEQQDAEGKGEIELPAREMLADMLLEMNRPADALIQYEHSMRIDPNRFNTLYGAGRAAELLGEHEKEKRYYGQLLRNCSAAKSVRSELAHARANNPESP